MNYKTLLISMAFSSALLLSCCKSHQNTEKARPNILWITIEDTSPHLCYGNKNARTPVIDQFIKGFPHYLQNQGYYTSNNQKTDYNIFGEKKFVEETTCKQNTFSNTG